MTCAHAARNMQNSTSGTLAGAETTMWRAVILQAVRDAAVGDPAAREARAQECGEARHFERALSLKRGTSMRGFWARVGGAGQRACTLLTWAGHGPLPGRRLEQEKKKVQGAAVVEQEKAGAARGTSSGRFR